MKPAFRWSAFKGRPEPIGEPRMARFGGRIAAMQFCDGLYDRPPHITRSVLLRLGTFVIALVLLLPGAVAQTAKPEDEPKQNGMLCGYMILLAFYGTGKACFAEGDEEFLQVVGQSIADIDAYILRNLPNATPELLASFKKKHMDTWKRGHPPGVREEDICKRREHEMIKSYLRWRKEVTAEQIRENTKEFLSVDRVPTMNPCL